MISKCYKLSYTGTGKLEDEEREPNLLYSRNSELLDSGDMAIPIWDR
jgi:hypothetical protein